MVEALMDELVEEILLRLPPNDPVTLLRAATVCRRWCRIISAAGFRSRFAEHHRPPPLLGFFANVRYGGCNCARFIPTTTRFFPRRAEYRDCRAVDARHGRVLLADVPDVPALDVWLPITDERRLLPAPPMAHELQDAFQWNAAVLCAAAQDECDHVHCSRDAFFVVFLDCNTEILRVHVYSSENGSWSAPTYGAASPVMGIEPVPPAHAGNMIWFIIDGRRGALGYDLTAKTMIRVVLPEEQWAFHGVLTTTDIGGLGLARIANSRILQWSMVTESERDGRWTDSRVMDLDNLLPVHIISEDYLGFEHSGGVFFIGALNGRSTFIISHSTHVTRVECGDGRTNGVVPFCSLYTPGPDLQKYGVAPP